jgi:hypothetical protein
LQRVLSSLAAGTARIKSLQEPAFIQLPFIWNSLCLRWLVGVKAHRRFSTSASYGISPFFLRFAQKGEEGLCWLKVRRQLIARRGRGGAAIRLPRR